MWLKYAEQIRESVEELAARERRVRGHPTADRFKMLRLLKNGTVRSRRELVEVLGYSERQLQRWWTQYVTGGLEAVEARKRPGGSTGRITPEAWGSLQEAMAMGQVARLKEVQRHLRQHCGIVYRGVSGLSRILKRHGVKLKTGRRQYRKADREQQEAFKKGLRSPPAPARH